MKRKDKVETEVNEQFEEVNVSEPKWYQTKKAKIAGGCGLAVLIGLGTQAVRKFRHGSGEYAEGYDDWSGDGEETVFDDDTTSEE